MKIKTLTMLWTFALIMGGCTSKKVPSQRPDDFAFILKSDEFEYDSQARRYNYYDRSVRVILTDKELDEIFKLAESIHYLDFPGEFRCNGSDGMIPCFRNDLQIGYNRRYKRCRNDNCCTKKDKVRSANFDLLVDKITEIMAAKEQVKHLPRYEVLYM